MGQTEGRRGFIRGIVMLSAGAAASALLDGCAAPGEADAAGPVERVPLRAGVRARAPLPRRVPSVRQIHFAPIRSDEVVSTKAARWQPQANAGALSNGAGSLAGG